MLRKKYFVLITAFYLCNNIFALAQSDIKRNEYEQFRRQAYLSYSDFKKDCNQQYLEFLKKSWEWYSVAPKFDYPIEKDKPPVIIGEDWRNEPIIDNELPYKDLIASPIVEPQPEPVSPIAPEPVINEKWFMFYCWGTELRVRVDDILRFRIKSLNGNDLSLAWKQILSSDYNNLLTDCLSIRDNRNFCDWAYLLMLASFSEQFLGKGNESVLLTAFLFSQSGYKMRLGVSDDSLILLFGSKHQIYNKPFFDIDGVYFYPMSEVNNRIKIANFSFPQEKYLSLLVQYEPELSEIRSKPRVFMGGRYVTNVSCEINTNLLDFFGGYPTSQINDNPLTRWAMYANTPLDTSVKESLYPQLNIAIEGKSTYDAVNILLNFVQTAFKYEYDDRVWGYDRAFFAEETLYYPYCDCEDRSIFFSRLVRDLLGLDVVLVYYPGHLATAVRFDEIVKGDYLSINDERFVICDPTYIGAPIGMTMPDMDNSKATVILLN